MIVAHRYGPVGRRTAPFWFPWVLVLGLVHATTAPCLADQGKPAAEDPSQAPRRRFGLYDYLGTASALALYYAIEFGLDLPTKAHWRKPVPLIDETFRDLLVLRSRSARDTAAHMADYLWYGATAYPVALGVIGPLALGRDMDQLWQLTMMNLQAYAVASIIVRLPHKLVGRSRPDVLGCEQDPDYSDLCGTDQQFVSFFGGHAAISMTGAGLACAHHQYAEPLGGGLPDRLGCALALGVVGGVFLMRMQADRHWLSDQLLAIAVGFSVGYGLPTALYYRPIFGDPEPLTSASFVLPFFGNGDLGAQWIGRF